MLTDPVVNLFNSPSDPWLLQSVGLQRVRHDLATEHQEGTLKSKIPSGTGIHKTER